MIIAHTICLQPSKSLHRQNSKTWMNYPFISMEMKKSTMTEGGLNISQKLTNQKETKLLGILKMNHRFSKFVVSIIYRMHSFQTHMKHLPKSTYARQIANYISNKGFKYVR